MNEIDNRILEFEFDNKRFEKNAQTTLRTLQMLDESMGFKNAAKGIDGVQKAFDSIKLDGISKALEAVERRVSLFGQFVNNEVMKVINKIETAGMNVYNQMFKLPKDTGFKEYELQMNAIQTIWANTKDKGTSMEDIKSALGELNTYADKTIYNFSQMTDNIGRFTAAGVDLNTSAKAIQGIANLAAVSGSTSQQASTAMYQLSQALAAGKVNLQDWNSVVNAGMGGQQFQNALIETARSLGIAVDMSEGFRMSLNDGWLTSEVLVTTLEKYTDLSTELGRTATEAATQVKTFSQLIDTTKEYLGSGWAQSWQYIVGDFEDARTLFTDLSQKLEGILGPSIKARNEMLKYWSENGEVNEEAKKQLEEQEKYNAELDAIAKRVIAGEFGTGQVRFDKLEDMGYDSLAVQNQVNKLMGYPTLIAEEHTKQIKAVFSGRDMAIQGFAKLFSELGKVVNAVREAFRDVFPKTTGEQLVAISKAFYEFTQDFTIGEKTVERIKDTFKGIFATFSIGIKIVKAIGSAFAAFFSVLPKGDNLILRITSTVGKAVYNFDKILEETGILKAAFSSFGKLVGQVVVALTSDIGSLIDIFTNFADNTGILNGFEAVYEKITEFVGYISSAILGLGDIPTDGAADLANKVAEPFSIFDKIGQGLKTAFEFIKGVFRTLYDFVAPVLEAVKDAIVNTIGSEELNIIMERLKEGGLLYLLYGLATFFKNLGKSFGGVGKLITAVSETFGALKETLNAFTTAVRAKALISIAIALGILAAAVLALGFLPKDTITNGFGVILGLGVELGLFMAILKKMSGSNVNDILKLSGALVIITTALSQMTGTILVMALIPYEKLGSGLLTLAGMMTVLVVSVKKLQGTNLTNVAGGILALSLSLKMLVPSLIILGLVPTDIITTGLLLLASIFGVFYGFMKLINASDMQKSFTDAAKALTLLSVAVNLLMVPLVIFGVIPFGIILQGFTSLILLMGAFVVLTNHLAGQENNLKGVGTYLIAMATALNMLVIPILILGNMQLDNLAKGFIAVAGTLAVLTIVTNSLSGKEHDLKGVGTYLLSMATALAALIAPIYIIGNMDPTAALIGLGSVMVMLWSLFGVTKLLSGDTKGFDVAAQGMLKMAAAMILLIYPIEKLGTMDTDTLIKGGVAAIGLLAVMAGTAKLLGSMKLDKGLIATLSLLVTSVALLAGALSLLTGDGGDGLLSAVVAVGALFAVIAVGATILAPLGPMLLSVGAGMLMIVGSIALLIVSIKMLTDGTTKAKEGISNAISKIGEVFQTVWGIIKGFFANIIETIAGLWEVIKMVGSWLINGFISVFGVIWEAVTGFFGGILENLGAVWTFIKDFFLGFGEKFMEIVGSVISFGANVIGAIVDGIKSVANMIWDAVVEPVLAIAGKVWTLAKDLKKAGQNILTGIVKGISSIGSNIWYGIKEAVANVGKKIKEQGFWSTICEFGQNIIEGLVQGIKSLGGKIWDVIKEAAGDAFEAFCDFFDIGSPSKLMRDTAKWIPVGAGLGIEDEASSFTDAMDSMGMDGMDSFKDSILTGIDTDSMMKTFSGAGSDIGNAFSGGMLDGFDINSLTKEVNGLTSAMNADINTNAYITPVFDSSSIQNGMADMGNMLNERTSILGDMNTSINGSSNYTSNVSSTFDDSRILNSIERLTNEVTSLGSKVERMQVVMDSGALVGAIAPDMDNALGRMSARKARGV